MQEILQPRMIRLEASTVCQLNCPSCPTASGEVGKALGSGFLKLNDFKKIVDDNPRVSHIELSNWGEIFLNKELVPIIRYAYKRNVALYAYNGTNLNTVKKEVLESLVKYRFRKLSCSIDGASQETYAQYRRNGNFKQVIENIKVINEFKRHYRCRYPQLKWQFVAFGHNEHEITQAQELARSLDMEFHLKLSWDDLYAQSFAPVRDLELIRRETGLGVATREEYWSKFSKLYTLEECCLSLWTQPQINYDGRLLGCCINYWGDYGNVFQEGLSVCLNNKKINDARRMLMGEPVMAQAMPCQQCKVYKLRQERSHWIQSNDTRERYAESRLYIMLENKILGARLTKWASSIFQALSKKRRMSSGVHPLRIPLSTNKNKAWQSLPLFRGPAAGMRELECHASVLLPGHCPHPPHRHHEEELLIVLSGEADIILPDAADEKGEIRRRIKTGEFVYYPRHFSHTLQAASDSPAEYLMFKWYAGRYDSNGALAFQRFDVAGQLRDSNKADGFQPRRIFEGKTEYLSKLECHFTTLAPKAGYPVHADDYDVAIVVLQGQVETIGKQAVAHDVIYYASGQPHGMRNPGEVAAKYLVFEFHGLKASFLSLRKYFSKTTE